MHHLDDKKHNIQIFAKYQQNLQKVNYCIPGILSKCSAGTSWADQMLCKFSIKSDYANKCMYFIESMDGHCDGLDAQKDAMISDHC
jgi:hypothetical protein